MAVYYIHGFGSCPEANEQKRKELELIFPNESVRVLGYDSALPYPTILNSLVEAVGDDEEPFFIGTSLGGLYARVLADHFAVQCAVFNPVIDPVTLLDTRLGMNMHYCTGLEFKLTKEVVNSYLSYIDNQSLHRNPTQVFIAKDDNVLNPEVTKSYFEKMACVIMIEGGHRITSLLPYSREIASTRNAIVL